MYSIKHCEIPQVRQIIFYNSFALIALIWALSIPVFLEYSDVLLRPNTLRDIKRTHEEIESVLRFIAYIGKPIPIHFLMRPNLRDENDNMFIDLAFASNARYIITQNVNDFTKGTELRFDQFDIITPAQFVRYWRQRYE